MWLILGGRGAGKTRAGAEWVSAQGAAASRRSAARRPQRIALVGETLGDVRRVMIEGVVGLAQRARAARAPALRAVEGGS